MTKKKKVGLALSTEQIKHLEFIQENITHLDSNSLHVKSAMTTFVAASLLSGTQNKDFILVAIFPTIIFWALDAYYLQQQRKFRGLYYDLTEVSKELKEIKPFAMPIHFYKDGKYSYWDVFSSFTILPLYSFVLMVLLAIYFFI